MLFVEKRETSDSGGNQSYSNFLEVCKLAGVLTTINKPTTGLLSLPNMDNYTATGASGAPTPDFDSNLTLFLWFGLKFYPFSLLTQPSTVTSLDTAVSVKVNLRPFLWQLFLGKATLFSAQIRLPFCSAPLTTPVALTAIAKSECLIPASQDPPTCNEI